MIVHDAARPLATPQLFDQALRELERHPDADAVIAAAPVTDTIKEVGGDGRTVSRTLDRARLWAVQTPQVFRRAALERALAQATEEELARATDDAWLIERAGGVVRVLGSDPGNLKITTPDDLRVAELLLSEREPRGSSAPMSTGIGYDCHRLVAGRRADPRRRASSSTTAGSTATPTPTCSPTRSSTRMLGAGALGDIGQHFPDTDPRYRDADSMRAAAGTVALLREAGFAVAPRRRDGRDGAPQARAPIVTGCAQRWPPRWSWTSRHVSVKATRGEGMGFVGPRGGRRRARRRDVEPLH